MGSADHQGLPDGQSDESSATAPTSDDADERHLAVAVRALLGETSLLPTANAEEVRGGIRILARWRRQLEPPALGPFGEFELVEELGGGSGGRVYRAVFRQQRRDVAIKIFFPKENFIEAAIRFHCEAEAALELSHPNVVEGIKTGDIDGRTYLAMEFAPRGNLRQFLQRQCRIPWPQAVGMAIDVARGLQYLNEQDYVHRDLKPSNLLVREDGSLVIADLGLVRKTAGEFNGSLTRTGQVLGSAHYMSPEQAIDSRVDIRSDIYSLGCVLYEMIVGKRPVDLPHPLSVVASRAQFGVPPLRHAAPDVPAALENVVARMTAIDRETRYQFPADVVEALESVLELQNAPPNRKSFQGSRRTWVAVTAGLGVSVAGMLAMWPLLRRLTPAPRGRDGGDHADWEVLYPTADSQVLFKEGEWVLRNRGWLISREDFPRGFSLEFDWRWTEGEGTYSDILTVGLRTSGRPGNRNWARETTDGLRIKFEPDPEPGNIFISDATSGTHLSQTWGPALPKMNDLHVRIESQSREVRIYLNYSENPVLATITPHAAPTDHVTIYNRERVAGIDKESRIHNLRLLPWPAGG